MLPDRDRVHAVSVMINPAVDRHDKQPEIPRLV